MVALHGTPAEGHQGLGARIALGEKEAGDAGQVGVEMRQAEDGLPVEVSVAAAMTAHGLVVQRTDSFGVDGIREGALDEGRMLLHVANVAARRPVQAGKNRLLVVEQVEGQGVAVHVRPGGESIAVALEQAGSSMAVSTREESYGEPEESWVASHQPGEGGDGWLKGCGRERVQFVDPQGAMARQDPAAIHANGNRGD